MRRCTSCVLSEKTPKIKFDERGVCNVCKDFNEQWSSFSKNKPNMENELNNIFSAFRNKGQKYDCLVPISGGLDSTYVLYVCKKIYDLRVLAFNFNNGFQTNVAKQNIENAIKKLNVDYVTISPDQEMAMKLHALFFKKTGEFCTPCNVGIWSTAFKIAKDYEIPLIVTGSSNRISERLPKGGRIYSWSKIYFQNVIRGEIPLETIENYLHVPENFHNMYIRKIPADDIIYPQILPLPDYLDWNSLHMLTTLENELNWMKKGDKFHHIDCTMESVNDYLKQRRWGFSSAIYYSMLVRTGQISRDEALKLTLKEEQKNSCEPPELEIWLERLGLLRDDLNGFENRNQSKYF